MPSDDLLDYAKSDIDFYAVLGSGLHAGSTAQQINSAYRKQSLTCHPDKDPSPEAATKFHALTIAKDVLLDEQARHEYHKARDARENKKRQRQMFDGQRRSMVNDLLSKEKSTIGKRKREEDEEELREREIRRLAEDGRRRRIEHEQALKKEHAFDSAKEEEIAEKGPVRNAPQGEVPVKERTVKVRWAREGLGAEVDNNQLNQMFARFGQLESSLVLKDRKLRLGDSKKKSVIAAAILVFESIVSAHAAVEDYKNQKGPGWDMLESVEWAEGKEPDCLASMFSPTSTRTTSAAATTTGDLPSTPAPSSKRSRMSFPGASSTPDDPLSAFKTKAGIQGGAKADGLRKVPSYASFSKAKFNSPMNSTFAAGPGSPSLEEITMIRLKKAEKSRLEEQIRREEAETDESMIAA